MAREISSGESEKLNAFRFSAVLVLFVVYALPIAIVFWRWALG